MRRNVPMGPIGYMRYTSLSADGTKLLAGGEDVRLADLTTGKTKRLSALKPRGVALSADATLAAFAVGSRVEIRRTDDGKLLQSLTGFSAESDDTRLVFSPNGRYLFALYLQDATLIDLAN